MLLHEDKEVFKQICSEVADNMGLLNFQIEKDYYVSLFLKRITEIDKLNSVVFKGGTSLSKCYNIIDRFSEDIDLALLYKNNKVTSAERKKLKLLISNVISDLNMKLLNNEEIKTRAEFNRYEVGYEKTFKDMGKMIPHIIVETIVSYQPFPCEKKTVSNYITKYISRIGRHEIINKYDLHPFEMNIQTVERTLVDKLFAICDYHLQGSYNRLSRHIYDIHMIWHSKDIDLKKVREIIPIVINSRKSKSSVNLSCQSGSEPEKIIIEIIKNEVFKKDFKEVTSTFIYVKVSYDACIESLKDILSANIVPKLINEDI